MTALHIVDGAAQERDKYAEIWSFPEYKVNSPGLTNVERFLSVMKPQVGECLLDVGCGAGVAGLAFERKGLKVTYLDITDAGLDPAVDRKRFIQAALWDPWWPSDAHWDYGFCCDVMEHLPPEYTMLVIDKLLWHCRKVWFHIPFTPDGFGHMIGQPLHLTVQPYSWWLVRLATLGTVLDARDLCNKGLFVVSRNA